MMKPGPMLHAVHIYMYDALTASEAQAMQAA